MRQCGILMPISSLPGPGGIGCFGKEAYAFVDFLAQAGQQIWQILPLSPTGFGDSPYQSCSAFAGNPYFIDLQTLLREGLLHYADLLELDWGDDPETVDYGAVYNNRFPLLRKAYSAFNMQCCGVHGFSHYPPDDYYAFTLKNEAWLDDYALYMALKTAHNMQGWQQWPEPLKNRDPEALAAFRAENEYEIDFWKFLQYEFDCQWRALHDYAAEKGVKILGDMPIYAAPDSADAWAGGPLFERTADGRFARVAGCPPDYFSADGQLWGNPLYDWEYHKRTGYAWWVQRMRRMLELYDIVRIDHFRGFDTYWAIPADSETARTGKWEQGPGIGLFQALEAALGGKLPIVAEDLGELFPSVRQLLEATGFPGMKVLQFAFSGGEEYLPYSYPKNCVVYPGTHDNTTAEDWWQNVASRKEKAFAARYLRVAPGQSGREAMLAAVLGSVADTAIIPMSDWLGMGAEGRLNTPGVLGGNWTWRAARGFDRPELADRIREECVTYGRTSPREKKAPAAAK